MAQITVRQIPDEVHRALKAEASQQGISAEARVRQILAEALLPAERERPGDVLHALWQGTGLDLDGVEFPRDRSPIRAAEFE